MAFSKINNSAILDTASKIISQNHGSAINYRLLRDVFELPENDCELSNARDELLGSEHVSRLAAEQNTDGGWGRFHSKDYSIKRRFGTTEIAVARAVALGLEKSSQILLKAEDYLSGILTDSIEFPDPPESNDRWDIGIKLFVAGTLALTAPSNPTLKPFRDLWIDIAEQTFASGSFNPQDEKKAHQKLTDATVYFPDGRETYLVIKSKYHIQLLGSKPGLLKAKTEKSLLSWLWSRPNGMGYLEVPLSKLPDDKTGYLDRWFTSQELLSGFRFWPEFIEEVAHELFSARNDNGLWDFGPLPRGAGVHHFPLVEKNTRSKSAREAEWSTRTILLLKKYIERR